MTTPSLDTKPSTGRRHGLVRSGLFVVFGLLALTLAACSGTGAEPTHTTHKSEFDLPLPDLHAVTFGGISGWYLLLIGMFICLAGFGFGLYSYMKLKNLPVHQSMRDVSELIYETCKAYLLQQGKSAFYTSAGAIYDDVVSGGRQSSLQRGAAWNSEVVIRWVAVIHDLDGVRRIAGAIGQTDCSGKRIGADG